MTATINEPPMVLVVEDGLLVAMAIEDVLLERGFDVLLAASLAAAEEFIAQAMPQAALLDLQLPDGQSVELARRLHEAGCRVAISSALDSGEALESCHFAARFGKPVSPDLLADWVASVTDAGMANPACPSPGTG